MTNAASSRFRVKKVSPKCTLPVYKESQLAGLLNTTPREMAAVDTGVQKDEEVEHDLQVALYAAHEAVTTGTATERSYIPTPTVSTRLSHSQYTKLYHREFNTPTTSIRFSKTLEAMVGCLYVLDEKDQVFLDAHRETHASDLLDDTFEETMWRLEHLTQQHLTKDPSQTPDMQEILRLYPVWPPERDINAIYAHWKSRRRNGGAVAQIRCSNTSRYDNDPYTCFRRRQVKSMRSTRRMDQNHLARLKTLRNDLEKARQLFDMVYQREKTRKEILLYDYHVFNQQLVISDLQQKLGIIDDDALMGTVPRKLPVIRIPLSRLQSPHHRDEGYEDVTQCPYQPFPQTVGQLYFKSVTANNTGARFRLRVGRGGRVLVDRTVPHMRNDPKFLFDTSDDDEDEDNEGLDGQFRMNHDDVNALMQMH